MHNKSVDDLKTEGNVFFQKGDHREAIRCYSMGLDIEENAILRGNRSACFFALKEFNAAAADAQAALNVDKMYIKGYFRLSAALKGLGKVTEAAYVAKAGLEIDPGNVALRKIVASAIRETRISDAPATKSVNDEMSPVELVMLSHLRGLLERLRKGEFDRGVANQHMLHGTFAEICSSSFRDTLFPGLSAKDQASLPGTLRQLLRWNNVGDIMTQQLHNMAKSAASILEGVRVRGAQRGDTMDRSTEGVLAPQIAQETFGREIIAVVRDINRQAAGANARTNLCVAVRKGDAARQVDDVVMDRLFRHNEIATQDYFLGKEWSRFLLNDIIRYSSDEKMSEVKFSNFIVPAGADKKLLTSDRAEMAWVEATDIDTFYPTLAAVINRLHDLPYEFNEISKSSMGLREPSRGVCMLIRVPNLCEQSFRFDNVIRENDSGLRLSCAYCVVPDAGPYSGVVSSFSFSSADDDLITVDIVNDRLIVFKSIKYRNSRSPAIREYYMLLYYIYGDPTLNTS